MLWLDGKGRNLGQDSVTGGWKALTTKAQMIDARFVKPAKARYCVVVGKLEGGGRGQPLESLASMGMRIVMAGGC